VVTSLPANSGIAFLIPGLERSPGVGNVNPLQYSCLKNSINGGAWRATIHEVTTSTHHFLWNSMKHDLKLSWTLSCVQLFVTPWTGVAKLPCPSLTSRACSNSCPSSQWCHPTILSSVVRFSSCLQSFSASGSFPVNQFFSSGGQSIGASASVLPMNIQDWFPLGWTGWISLKSKGLWSVFSNTTVKNHHSTVLSLLYGPILTSIHDYGKTVALTRWTFVGKVMSLLFNMLSRLVTVFLPRSKCLLISWLHSPSAVILPWSDGTKCHDLSFLNAEF